MIKTVAEVMNKEVITVTSCISVATAVNIMKEFRVSGLPVVENERLIGIITSRDLRDAHPNRLVADAMTHDVIVVRPGSSLWEARDLLEKNRIERLVVVDDNAVVGMITESAVYAELGRYIDPMTELPKADCLYQKGVELLREYQDIAVIFIDIDNFGLIDKEYGHVVGDNVLKQLAKILKDNIPNAGYLCRYGGDEFALIMPATNDEAKESAKLLVNKIAKTVIADNIRISASAGVAGGRRNFNKRTHGQEINTIKNLVNLASLASTTAKHHGCSVVVADSVQLIQAY